jgi:Alpha/beta hydrolase family
VNALRTSFPKDAPQPPILPPKDGFLFLDRDKFHASFAGDLPADRAAFMADSQVPWGVNALAGTISNPAWRSKPAWYLITTQDKMIPPAAQQTMCQRAGATATQVAASHSGYVSQPAAVASFLEQTAAA